MTGTGYRLLLAVFFAAWNTEESHVQAASFIRESLQLNGPLPSCTMSPFDLDSLTTALARLQLVAVRLNLRHS